MAGKEKTTNTPKPAPALELQVRDAVHPVSKAVLRF